MSIESNNNFKKICRYSGLISLICLLLVMVGATFGAPSYQGISICLAGGAINLVFMVRSWRYQTGVAAFLSVMVVVLAIGVSGKITINIGGEFFTYMQHFGAIFAATFGLLYFNKSVALKWVAS